MTRTRDILDRIERAEPGWVFTPSDLFDLGSAHLVGMVLLGLVRSGRIRRLRRGLYDVPKVHPKLGALAPTALAIAHAIARRDGSTVRESEAAAANLLRLSEQVPAQLVFQTDGRSQDVVVGMQRVRLRRRATRKLAGLSESTARVFSALRELGKEHVDEEHVRRLRELLSNEQRRQLLVDLRRAPRWMHPILRGIASDGPVTPAPRGDGA